jgi:2-desacetyl-2-hydroxyethyl bacteriochlorophyllide A dehydrogenase
MKAAIFHGPMEISQETLEQPAIGPTDVLIKVRSCCICGSDLHMYKLGLFIDIICRKSEGKLVPGHEFSGDIVAAGDQVEGLAAGDRVVAFCNGGMAEMVPVSPALVGANVFKIPDHIDYPEAATIEPLANSVHAALKGDPQPGDNVVVFGAGVIGLGVIQVLQALDVGLGKIIAVDVSDKRLEMAKQLGADATINVASMDLITQTIDQVGSVDLPIAAGMQLPAIDIAYDCVGYIQDRPEAPVLQQALSVVRPGTGRIVAHGVFEAPVTMDFSALVAKQVSIMGSFGMTAEDTHLAIQLMSSGKIDRAVLISHQFPLEQVETAFQTQATVSDSIKVLISP